MDWGEIEREYDLTFRRGFLFERFGQMDARDLVGYVSQASGRPLDDAVEYVQTYAPKNIRDEFQERMTALLRQ